MARSLASRLDRLERLASELLSQNQGTVYLREGDEVPEGRKPVYVRVTGQLMGLNYRDYLQEAHRLVRYGGWLKIAAPASRWRGEKLDELLRAITSSGFSMVGQPLYRGRFIYLDATKS